MNSNNSGYRNINVSTVTAFDDVLPIGSRARAVDAALNVLSSDSVSKQAKALGKDARGAVSNWIAACAIAGVWSQVRNDWMNEVALAAIASGKPLTESHTTDDGKKVKGWRESSTIATYASNGATIETQHRAACEQHARLLERAKEQNPSATDRELYAMVPPNPFRGVEGLGKLYRVATEYAKSVEARDEAATVTAAAIEAEKTHAEQAIRKHVERVANDPDSVVADYLAEIQAILNRAAVDGAAIVQAVTESLADSLTAPQDEELLRLEALVSAETQAPPVNLSKAA